MIQRISGVIAAATAIRQFQKKDGTFSDQATLHIQQVTNDVYPQEVAVKVPYALYRAPLALDNHLCKVFRPFVTHYGSTAARCFSEPVFQEMKQTAAHPGRQDFLRVSFLDTVNIDAIQPPWWRLSVQASGLRSLSSAG